MKISDRVILPLVGSAFQPGKAAEAIEKIEDKELAQIAQGEYYFFSAQDVYKRQHLYRRGNKTAV